MFASSDTIRKGWTKEFEQPRVSFFHTRIYGSTSANEHDSWKALGKGIVAKYGERLVSQLDENDEKSVIDVKVNLEKAHGVIVEFISKLSQKSAISAGGKEVAFSNKGKHSIRGNFLTAHEDRISGEAIFRSDKFVHLAVSALQG